jgi:hypothetical protein
LKLKYDASENEIEERVLGGDLPEYLSEFQIVMRLE